MECDQHIAYILDASGAANKVTTKDDLCQRLSDEIQRRFPLGTHMGAQRAQSDEYQ